MFGADDVCSLMNKEFPKQISYEWVCDASEKSLSQGEVLAEREDRLCDSNAPDGCQGQMETAVASGSSQEGTLSLFLVLKIPASTR